MAAGLVDALILRVRKRAWEYPSGAVLSAAIVVMVLRSQEPWYVPTVTSVIAVLSKYVFRSRRANVFNPAALAIVASYYLFHAGQSWWGAQTDLPGPPQLVMILAGVYIANRVNKMPLVLAFLGAYFGLFTLTAFAGHPLPVAEIFRTPDLEAALYFAFFILTDPPTSPIRYRRPGGVRPDRGGGRLRVLPTGGGGVLSAGGRAGGQCVGGMATGKPPRGPHFPEGLGRFSARDRSLASQPGQLSGCRLLRSAGRQAGVAGRAAGTAFLGKSPKSARPGSAAIFAVYLAGYIRTMSRADQFANEVAERRMAGRASRRVASVRDGAPGQDDPHPARGVARSGISRRWVCRGAAPPMEGRHLGVRRDSDLRRLTILSREPPHPPSRPRAFPSNQSGRDGRDLPPLSINSGRHTESATPARSCCGRKRRSVARWSPTPGRDAPLSRWNPSPDR